MVADDGRSHHSLSTATAECMRLAVTISQGFLELVLEKLTPLGTITTRRLFGSASVSQDGSIFALVRGDELYFKVDATTRPQFGTKGSAPFCYETKSGTHIINSYWRAPKRLFNDPGAMHDFARAALAAGRRADAKKQPKKPKVSAPQSG